MGGQGSQVIVAAHSLVERKRTGEVRRHRHCIIAFHPVRSKIRCQNEWKEPTTPRGTIEKASNEKESVMMMLMTRRGRRRRRSRIRKDISEGAKEGAMVE